MRVAGRAGIFRISSAVVVMAAALSAGVRGQTAANKSYSSMVTFHLEQSNEPPIKIVRVMVGQTEVPLDQPVHVEGMWMPQFSVVLQNVSQKTIVRTGISLRFPDAIAASEHQPKYGFIYGAPMWVGRRPKHAYLQRDGTMGPVSGPQLPPVSIAPGAMFTVTMLPRADWLQSHLYEYAGHISKVTLSFDQTYFSDDSQWDVGFYLIAVPPPTLWKRVTPEGFSAGTGVRDSSRVQ